MSKEPTLQDLLKRDAEKIAEIKKSRQNEKIEPEWLLLAEFGLFFGWQAIKDVREDNISFQEMNKLLAAARRMKAIERHTNITDMYSAFIVPHDKGKALKQTLKGIKDTFNE